MRVRVRNFVLAISLRAGNVLKKILDQKLNLKQPKTPKTAKKSTRAYLNCIIDKEIKVKNLKLRILRAHGVVVLLAHMVPII